MKRGTSTPEGEPRGGGGRGREAGALGGVGWAPITTYCLVRVLLPISTQSAALPGRRRRMPPWMRCKLMEFDFCLSRPGVRVGEVAFG